MNGVTVEPVLSYYNEYYFNNSLPAVVVPDIRLDPSLFNVSKVFESLVNTSAVYLCVCASLVSPLFFKGKYTGNNLNNINNNNSNKRIK